MDEQVFRAKTIEIELQRLSIEKSFFRKHFATVVGAIVTLVISITAGSGISSYNETLQISLAQRKLDVVVTYVSSVNQAWASYSANQLVDGALRQTGIDAFEELRLIGSDTLVNKATRVNGYFSTLYHPHTISEEQTNEFNSAMIELNQAAKAEFQLLRK